MLKRSLSVILIMILSVTALAEGYTALDAPVFREVLTEETAPLRFYDDHPSVPCMGLEDYYRLMLGCDMPVEHSGDGVYTFAAADGTLARVDVNAGTLTCDDYLRFTNLMGRVAPGMENQYLDAPAFVRPDGLEVADPAPVALDFARYHIPLHGGEADVYLPLATLSDMFTNLAYIYVSWNGEKVYVNADNRMPAAWRRDPDYAAPIYSRAERAPDMAAFAYDELCFAVDTFYGFPGRAPINDVLMASGLDAALQTFSDDTRRCRALLRSEKLGEYALGSRLLGALLDDGGHTRIDFTALYTDNPAFSAFAEDFRRAQRDDVPDRAVQILRRAEDAALRRMKQLRRKAYGNVRYAEKGDTAVICFDSFMYDFDGWQAYYESGAPRPEDDQMARVLDGLNRAADNPEIKNVVFDISCNRGGSADMVAAIMSLIADASTFAFENRLIHRVATQKYRVDRNFDGVFDAQDADVRYDFNFGVLTSRYSYSCANLLPSLMRDRGMTVLGEVSGGGTCAVAMHATPEGFAYRLSSGLGRLINAAGADIDAGVPVDVALTDGRSYADFYDLYALSRAMNAVAAARRPAA